MSVFKKIVCPATKKNSRNSEGDAVVLENGDILLAYSDFFGFGDFDRAQISGKISKDGGYAWGKKFTLQENEGKVNVMCASFLRLHSGEICHFYGKKNSIKDLKFYKKISSDDGQHWSKPVCVTPCAGYMQLTNNGAIQLKSGRILFAVSHTPGINHFKCFTSFSDDSGKTWKKGRTVIDLPKRGADEPKVIELKDGRVMMIIRNQLGYIYKSYSSDGGDTWSKPEPMSLVSSESPAAINRIPQTGDLLIIWNNVFNLDDGSHHCGGRCPLTAAISRDDGEKWENMKNIEADRKNDYGYPSITFVGEKVLLTYYVGNYQKERWSLGVTLLPISWFYQK